MNELVLCRKILDFSRTNMVVCLGWGLLENLRDYLSRPKTGNAECIFLAHTTMSNHMGVTCTQSEPVDCKSRCQTNDLTALDELNI